jgi:hypothetical protein
MKYAICLSGNDNLERSCWLGSWAGPETNVDFQAIARSARIEISRAQVSFFGRLRIDLGHALFKSTAPYSLMFNDFQ